MPTETQLTPEELAWYKVASHLGRTVGELKELLTPSELNGWLEYLRWERSQHSKEDYYLAQIASVMAQCFAKEGQNVGVSRFLLDLKNAAEEEEQPKQPEMTRELAAGLSRARWARALGFTNN